MKKVHSYKKVILLSKRKNWLRWWIKILILVKNCINIHFQSTFYDKFSFCLCIFASYPRSYNFAVIFSYVIFCSVFNSQFTVSNDVLINLIFREVLDDLLISFKPFYRSFMIVEGTLAGKVLANEGFHLFRQLLCEPEVGWRFWKWTQKTNGNLLCV